MLLPFHGAGLCYHPKAKASTDIKSAGGQCMPDSHCPTKTLSVHGEIWPDQPDVLAICFLCGKGLSQEPQFRVIRLLTRHMTSVISWVNPSQCVGVCVCVCLCVCRCAQVNVCVCS